MGVYIGYVGTFRYEELPSPREQAVKVLEEAAELFGALDTHGYPVDDVAVSCECCDVIQAVCNLMASVGHARLDLRFDMQDCRQRNESRGRVYDG